MTPAVGCLAGVLVALAVLALPGRGPGPGTLLPPPLTGDAAPPTGRSRWSVRRRHTDGGDTTGLLTLVEALAPALRAGLPAGAAVVAAIEVLDADPSRRGGGAGAAPPGAAARSFASELLPRAQAGEPLGPGWEAIADRTGCEQARLLARAWRISEVTGAPLADAAATAARLLRDRTAQRRRIDAAVAGARATIRVLSILPLGGPLLAVAVGVDPVAAYLRSPLAWVCLLVGALLTVIGRRWVHRLVGAVASGPLVR